MAFALEMFISNKEDRKVKKINDTNKMVNDIIEISTQLCKHRTQNK